MSVSNDTDAFLEGLCVALEFQGRGVGHRTMLFIEQEFADIKRWSLAAPSDKEENPRFYKAHGYRIIKAHRDMGVLVSTFEKILEE